MHPPLEKHLFCRTPSSTSCPGFVRGGAGTVHQRLVRGLSVLVLGQPLSFRAGKFFDPRTRQCDWTGHRLSITILFPNTAAMWVPPRSAPVFTSHASSSCRSFMLSFAAWFFVASLIFPQLRIPSGRRAILMYSAPTADSGAIDGAAGLPPPSTRSRNPPTQHHRPRNGSNPRISACPSRSCPDPFSLSELSFSACGVVRCGVELSTSACPAWSCHPPAIFFSPLHRASDHTGLPPRKDSQQV